MNSTRFDRWLWRVNGTLLLLLCLGSFLGTLVIGGLGWRGGRRGGTADIVKVNEKTQAKEKLRLGYFRELKGTPYVLVPLQRAADDERLGLISAYEGKGDAARNYLLFHSGTKESRWVWPDHGGLVFEAALVNGGQESGDRNPVTGMLFERVGKDSNGDGAVNGRDQRSLELLDLASGKLMTVLPVLDRLVGLRQTPGELLVFYSLAGKSWFVAVNPKSLAVSAPREFGAF